MRPREYGHLSGEFENEISVTETGPEVIASDDREVADIADQGTEIINVEEARDAVDRAFTETDRPTDFSHAEISTQATTHQPGSPVSKPGLLANFHNTVKHVIPGIERSPRPKVAVRPATTEDIPRLAEIDLAMFDDAYGDERPPQEAVESMLRARLENTGDWMIVAEVGGVVGGFVTGQVTDKLPEDFESWEETTNHGTLESAVEPNGSMVYIVNLTVEGNASRYDATDTLMLSIYGKVVEAGKDGGYWVSRMPRFRRWLHQEHDLSDDQISELANETLDSLAETYFQAEKSVRGQRKPLDPQVRLYKDAGFTAVKLAKEAFHDPASLNYGVVFKEDNPVPRQLRVKPINWLAGKAIRLIARSPRVASKFMS